MDSSTGMHTPKNCSYRRQNRRIQPTAGPAALEEDVSFDSVASQASKASVALCPEAVFSGSAF